ncbi:hypothetical protein L1049_022999 [Liquidambar formosana]|uniref:Protein phosphatase n=1 Tax=Liquidambar formosana TaxID=63359 RepID=A0AAP0RF81_LIQFO
MSEEKRLKMVAGAFNIPNERYSKPQGDDAHFICVDRETIGVADGVGSWARKGVDAGQYARKLMSNCVDAIQNEAKAVDPKWVLTQAYEKTDVEGSSTACIITIRDHFLHAANVGDSGFVLIKKGSSVYQSPIQVRSFNHPYQLGKESDGPSSAQVLKIPVKAGDVIVAGTDGLFDNMFANQIEDIVKMGVEDGVAPEQMAWAIAEHAYHNSVDAEANTPIMEASFKAGKPRSGGKIDDITVLVAYIVDS